MKILRTPDSRFENLPDYPFEPHYLTIKDRSEDVEIRVHYIDEGDSAAQPVLMLHGEPSWSCRRLDQRAAGVEKSARRTSSWFPRTLQSAAHCSLVCTDIAIHESSSEVG